MKFDLISIIIPVYNAENYICRAVESSLAQSYPNVEIIIVNDGSTDDTLKILKESYGSISNVYIFNIENSGVANARNYGIDKANGEYICFLDSDDELYDDALDIMVKSIKENDADICVAREAKFIQKFDGAVVPYGNLSNNSEESIVTYSGKEALLRSIKGYSETSAAWGKLYKREFIGDTRFPCGMRAHEDGHFVFLLLTKGAVMNVISAVLYKYYLHQESTTKGNFSDKYIDILQLAEERVKIVCENYPELVDNTYNIMLNACITVLANTARYSGTKYKNVERKCKKYIKKNKTHYVPMNSGEQRVFRMVISRLYWFYKLRVRASLFIKRVGQKIC